MLVRADRVEYDGGTVGLVHGRRDEDDRPVIFGIEWRFAIEVAEAIERGEEPLCEVESWQVLG